jgi:hypothetical protein
LSRLLYEIKTLVAMHPSVAIPVARMRGHGEVVARDTEIVIEGFPRTGTSFAVAAFRRSQRRPVKVAHHVHAPAQVMAAVRLRIPALVLIRAPEDSILSVVLRNPRIDVGRAMTGYQRFYRPLLRMRNRFVGATFEDVISHFGEVIGRVNDHYGTDFVPFHHTEESAASVLAEIEEDYLTRVAPGERFERIVPRPSDRRRELKEELRDRYRDPALAGRRRRIGLLYERFLSG